VTVRRGFHDWVMELSYGIRTGQDDGRDNTILFFSITPKGFGYFPFSNIRSVLRLYPNADITLAGESEYNAHSRYLEVWSAGATLDMDRFYMGTGGRFSQEEGAASTLQTSYQFNSKWELEVRGQFNWRNDAR